MVAQRMMILILFYFYFIIFSDFLELDSLGSDREFFYT